MVIGDERRDIGPGDLVSIPPDAVHSLETLGDAPIHCFCFAVGIEGAGRIDYTTH
jgi:mannose-6-phosphate isomerase-like protein (cupin superfamily)